jgi:hypothetical protein
MSSELFRDKNHLCALCRVFFPDAMACTNCERLQQENDELRARIAELEAAAPRAPVFGLDMPEEDSSDGASVAEEKRQTDSRRLLMDAFSQIMLREAHVNFTFESRAANKYGHRYDLDQATNVMHVICDNLYGRGYGRVIPSYIAPDQVSAHRNDRLPRVLFFLVFCDQGRHGLLDRNEQADAVKKLYHTHRIRGENNETEIIYIVVSNLGPGYESQWDEFKDWATFFNVDHEYGPYMFDRSTNSVVLELVTKDSVSEDGVQVPAEEEDAWTVMNINVCEIINLNLTKCAEQFVEFDPEKTKYIDLYCGSLFLPQETEKEMWKTIYYYLVTETCAGQDKSIKSVALKDKAGRPVTFFYELRTANEEDEDRIGFTATNDDAVMTKKLFYSLGLKPKTDYAKNLAETIGIVVDCFSELMFLDTYNDKWEQGPGTTLKFVKAVLRKTRDLHAHVMLFRSAPSTPASEARQTGADTPSVQGQAANESPPTVERLSPASLTRVRPPDLSFQSMVAGRDNSPSVQPPRRSQRRVGRGGSAPAVRATQLTREQERRYLLQDMNDSYESAS